ncbi:MAG: type 3 dihydrofolate reductase [Clostridiales bacterium]|nr:type 3 dihydrofolate reductase [Clostridiales bacterium]
MISIIVAMDRNRVIGKNNRMPWKLPADLAYFRKVTLGHTVVMGRKTFESIGKPLEGRKNIILTRNEEYAKEGCLVVHSLEEALKMIQDEKECFIIGGAKIYSAFLPYAQKLYITYIDHEFEGDTYFPEINYDQWRMVSRIPGPQNEKIPFDYYFEVYERNNK